MNNRDNDIYAFLFFLIPNCGIENRNKKMTRSTGICVPQRKYGGEIRNKTKEYTYTRKFTFRI